MTYPSLPYGSAHKPLKLTNGAYVCDEPNQDDCPGNPPWITTPLYGDLAGDGSQHAVIEIFVGGGDYSSYSVRFFGKDSQCHLQLLGQADDNTVPGAIVGHGYVADLIYAKDGENLGVGNTSGVEHAEWRFVKGQVLKTVSVKK
jgi:hypothetical protein